MRTMLVLRPGLVAAVAALAMLTAGCDDGVGNDGKVVGGPCAASADCEEGSFCLGGSDLRFPGGTCSKRCGIEAECPGDSACVRDVGGVCLLPCADASTCREGYECNFMPNQSGEGSTAVCIVEVQQMAQ
jgi:predicted small secreted protein